MTGELFLASVLFAAGCSVTVYLLLAARMNRRSSESGRSDDFDLTPIETRLSDLVTDMNRVANSHTKAIADRRDELKRVIEMANDRIRRLNTQLADLAILEQRIRDPRRAEERVPGGGNDAMAGQEPSEPSRRSPRRAAPRAAAPSRDEDGGPPRDTVVEDEAGAGWPAASARGRSQLPVDRVLPSEGGSWVFEVPPPVDGQERARDIESLAAEGLAPAAIASRLRLPLYAVEQVLGGSGRH